MPVWHGCIITAGYNKRAKRTMALHWETERLDGSTVGEAEDVAQLK